ncbi:coiled-coil domain-containing protein 71 isoform X2 [Pelodiscus sinensis]|uniref:coiled-coil domain-containing protein 71 isoform X2 n=1 Tax=Pelodiscus sinensis TaxID=13735 RepID=UPI003F6AD47F
MGAGLGPSPQARPEAEAGGTSGARRAAMLERRRRSGGCGLRGGRCPVLIFKEFGPLGSSWPNAMNIEVNNGEEKAVHSWSRLSSAGQKALEEALRVFNPMSKDLSDTETQLVAFLQGLREEGYQPTILRSKDVYGYSSCTADTPSQAREGAAASHCTRTLGGGPAVTPELPGTLAGLSVSPSVPAKPGPKGSATNLLLNSLKETRTGPSKASAMGFPTTMYPDVYPAMRLSVVLEALVPLKAPASCLEPRRRAGRLGLAPSDLKLLKASPLGKNARLPSGPLEPSGCRHLAPRAPDSASLAGKLLRGAEGGVLKESNACKASGILNGRVTESAAQSGSGGAKEGLAGRSDWKGGSGGQKRKRAEEVKAAAPRKRRSAGPAPSSPELGQSALALLLSRAIKVAGSSDEEVRRRAQQILRVNLSPVIRIQPLPRSPNVP